MQMVNAPTEGRLRRKNVSIASPTASIESVNVAVKALYTYKRPAKYTDIAAAAGAHPATISAALSASRDLGLSKLAGQKGLYVLTEEGQDYARLISTGKLDES